MATANKIIAVNNTVRTISVSVTNHNEHDSGNIGYFDITARGHREWVRDNAGAAVKETVYIWKGEEQDRDLEVKIALPNQVIVIT
jgi:hypothetical protein